MYLESTPTAYLRKEKENWATVLENLDISTKYWSHQGDIIHRNEKLHNDYKATKWEYYQIQNQIGLTDSPVNNTLLSNAILAVVLKPCTRRSRRQIKEGSTAVPMS